MTDSSDSFRANASDASPLSADAVYDALSAARRRYVVDYLRTRDEPTTLTAVADEVAARENGLEDGSKADVETVEISLHHVHLPKLTAAGLAEYDDGARTVALTEDGARLDVPTFTE